MVLLKLGRLYIWYVFVLISFCFTSHIDLLSQEKLLLCFLERILI
jgi:hypothetical protein